MNAAVDVKLDRHLAGNCSDDCCGTINEAEMQDRLLPEDKAGRLAELFKALGDGTRLKVIYALLQGELCVHDLSRLLGMGQSAVSHQLRVLRVQRIVKRRKVGKTVFYSLDDHHIEQIFLQTLQHTKHD